ncbi:MAG: PD-(D/E)XK nuclease domain-containing protein [Campylobacterota bacterium]|nr:PD-(D/E)XK nuclease domain-containing protein [Campylobacterota bacterium]
MYYIYNFDIIILINVKGKYETKKTTIKLNDAIYILEFKVDGQKGEAMKQIKEKKYHEKYLTQNQDIFLLGIEFDTSDENISNFEWEKI